MSINTEHTYDIAGYPVLSHDAFNLRVGRGAGNDTGTGEWNTFVGENAGHNNGNRGLENTFVGNNTGVTNTDGTSNTFMGAYAGIGNTTGSYNSFIGRSAGGGNSTGSYNTFTGAYAGYNSTTGASNAFYGYSAGMTNTTGAFNIFVGNIAGAANTTGNTNTFLGSGAGGNNSTGSGNIFVGAGAGDYNTAGSNDIYIGHSGPGTGKESNTIRIGTAQKVSYMAGIYGALASGGVPVTINAHGQLGTVPSSLRFKEQIQDMGDTTHALMKLRPVTFLYKAEYDQGDRTLQYGLIAEEVAKVYPELVAYDDDGQPFTIRYQYLTTMLLNEVQKQYRRAETQAQVIEQLEERVSRLEKLVESQLQTVAQK